MLYGITEAENLVGASEKNSPTGAKIRSMGLSRL